MSFARTQIRVLTKVIIPIIIINLHAGLRDMPIFKETCPISFSHVLLLLLQAEEAKLADADLDCLNVSTPLDEIVAEGSIKGFSPRRFSITYMVHDLA